MKNLILSLFVAIILPACIHAATANPVTMSVVLSVENADQVSPKVYEAEATGNSTDYVVITATISPSWIPVSNLSWTGGDAFNVANKRRISRQAGLDAQDVKVTLTYSGSSTSDSVNVTVVEILKIEPANGKNFAREGVEKFFQVTTKPANKYSIVDSITVDAASKGAVSTNYNTATGLVGVTWEPFDTGSKDAIITAKNSSMSKDCTIKVYGWVHDTGFPKDTPTSDPGISGSVGSFDYKYATVSASGTTLSMQFGLQVFENLPLNSDSDAIPAQNAKIIREDKWHWGGPDSTAPNKSKYKLQFTGDGSITANAESNISGFGFGRYAAASISFSASGQVAGDGGPNDKFEMKNVGALADSNIGTSASGTKTEGASPSISGSITATPAGSHALSSSGTWTVLAQNSQREFAGTTATFMSVVNAVGVANASASGALLGPATGTATGTMTANQSFTTLERPKPMD